MKVKWLGHASFLITDDKGTRIITDPYAPASNLHYEAISEAADIVTVSHEHGDHSNTAAVQGNPEVVRASAEIKGIKFTGIPTFHDDAGGEKRGNNVIFCFAMDGVKVCHLGDLGHPLSDREAAAIGSVDVLLIPVGGFYTIDAAVAGRVSAQIKPRVIIPMHFRNEKCEFPITGVDEFLKGKTDIDRLNTSETEFKAADLPAATRIIVLKPAK